MRVSELLPSTDGYMTYDGSTTYPGCWESVAWVVMNRPVYVTRGDMERLRELMQGDKKAPKAPIAPNVRPVHDLGRRAVRTNVDFEGGASDACGRPCPDVADAVRYTANKGW